MPAHLMALLQQQQLGEPPRHSRSEHAHTVPLSLFRITFFLLRAFSRCLSGLSDSPVRVMCECPFSCPINNEG